MKESDKRWRHSAKLQAALVAGGFVIFLVCLNVKDEQIVLRAMGICEAVIIAALGGRVSMQVGQSIMDSIHQMKSQEIGNYTYTPQPKDVDDGQVP